MPFKLFEPSRMRYLLSSGIVIAGFFVVNVLNYLFTLLISRMLGVAQFGEVTAVISLAALFAVPGSALSMLMTREVAFELGRESGGIAREMVIYVRRHAYLASLAFWIVALCCAPAFAKFFSIPLVPMLLFSLVVPLSLFAAFQGGALQGYQAFAYFVSQNVLSTAIKLAVSLALVALGFSVSGVVGALLLGSAASVALGMFAGSRVYAARPHPAIAPELRRLLAQRVVRAFPVIFSTVFLLALQSNMDVLLAKHFLQASDAGLYGALSTVGKIVVYAVGAFVAVLLPAASGAAGSGKGSGRVLALSLALIGASSLCAVVAFSLAPSLIVRLVFGARYLGVAPYLPLFSVAMLFVSLSNALANYFVAIQNKTFVWFLAAALALETVLISLAHGSIEEIVRMLALSTASLLALFAFNYAFFCRKSA